MSYILAKQAGITMDFTYSEQAIFPAIGRCSSHEKKMVLLPEKAVYDGATLYISEKDGDLQNLRSLQVSEWRVDSAKASGCVNWGNAIGERKMKYQATKDLLSLQSYGLFR